MRSSLLFPALLASAALAACAAPSSSSSDDVALSEHDLATPNGQAVTVTIEADYEGPVDQSADQLKFPAREQLKWTLPQLAARDASVRIPWIDELYTSATMTTVGDTHRLHWVVDLEGVWRGPLPASSFELDVPKSEYAIWRAGHEACAPEIDDARSEYFPYHFDPSAPGCSFDASKLTKVKVTVVARVDPNATTGKSPRYSQAWEDDTLRVVTLFDKDKDDASWLDRASTDEGIAAFRTHLAWLDAELGTAQRTERTFTPVAPKPEVQNVVVRHQATLPDGRVVIVESVLMNPTYNHGNWYPTLNSTAPHVDAVISNSAAFAKFYLDPDPGGSLFGGAPDEAHRSLLVQNGRYSYTFTKPRAGWPDASWNNIIRYGGDVPFSAQPALTKKIIEALEGRTETFDTLLAELDAVHPHMVPVVMGEQTNP